MEKKIKTKNLKFKLGPNYFLCQETSSSGPGVMAWVKPFDQINMIIKVVVKILGIGTIRSQAPKFESFILYIEWHVMNKEKVQRLDENRYEKFDKL